MKKEEKKYKEIELRSEEVQEIMNRVPPWILRGGITLLFCIVIILLIGSFFFKYPDVIQAEITVTSQEPPAGVIARSAGKIDEIYVVNSSEVRKGEPLAVINNPADTDDMLTLLMNMELWEISDYGIDQAKSLFPSRSVSLGAIQSVYATFINSLNDFINHMELDYYPKKIASQKEQLLVQQEYLNMLKEQTPVIFEQYNTYNNIFKRDSVLFSRDVISENEYELAKSSFLQSKQSFISFNASLKHSDLQQMQGEETLLDLQQQAFEVESRYRLTLHNATDALKAQIKAWEQDYLMVSPVNGIVNHMGVWSSNQNVLSGETVFTVLPSGQDTPRGKAMLPVQGAGKVNEGQRVNVRLNNFPDQEFGYLIGNVASISNVPTDEGLYVVEISFPEGMKTNYDRMLPVTRQMQGIAEIITEDLRLIERFFMPIKKMIRNQQI